MINNGFIRVGIAVPKVFLGNPIKNVQRIVELAKQAQDASIICFPELALTGYSIGDWFNNQQLIDETNEAIKYLVENSTKQVWIVGAPCIYNNHNYNCAYVIQNKKILGIVPKMHLPEYREFFEKRIFHEGLDFLDKIVKVNVNGEIVTFGECIFENDYCKFGIEICEDLWHINAPNELLYTAGAHIMFNLSASTFHVNKAKRRVSICENASYLGKGAYVYVSSSISETSSDVIMSGHSIVCENGELLYNKSALDTEEYIDTVDIDLENINYARRTTNINYRRNASVGQIPYDIVFTNNQKLSINRTIDPLPFTLKTDEAKEEVISAVTYALYHRLMHIGIKKVVLGVSGGLDSTLALLVAYQAFKKLNYDMKNIIAVTMPGFGTSDRTLNNAMDMMKKLGLTVLVKPIKDACLDHFKIIEHDPNIKDITFENTQARMRTMVLMDLANKYNGLVLGTGDLSELALGWCTYNGDQMSMYGINAGIPKTMVRFMIENYAKFKYPKLYDCLMDIVHTPISPELVGSDQKTEYAIGKY